MPVAERVAERMRMLALVAAAFSATGAAGAEPETRPVTEAERSAFHAYYQKRFPEQHSEAPRFLIERRSGADPWTISAVVDRTPQRGYRQLCRMRRVDFLYFSDTRSWSAAEGTRQFVWLNAAAGCALNGQPVELKVRMPDTELVSILTQQEALLASARLLMAGNSGCAPQRAYRYSLAAVDVGATGSGAEEMVALTYNSDRATRVTVWARRSGAEYSPWNVSCSA